VKLPIKVQAVPVRRQPNGYDCGIYLIECLNLYIKNDKRFLFDHDKVIQKRIDLKEYLRKKN
jgi:Ulp1 family protease